MPTGGDTRNSEITYIGPEPDRHSRLREHPQLPALQIVAGGETAAVIEEHPEQPITVRGLLVDALRSIDARLVMPAEHLARARWQREHRKKPWSEVPPALRASLLTQAETDLIAARGLDDRHDWHPRIELVVVEDPDEGPQEVRVFLDGVEVTSTSVTEVRIDPGRGYSSRDWDQLGRDIATMALSPRARDVAVLEHAAAPTPPRAPAMSRGRVLTGMLVAACVALALLLTSPLGASRLPAGSLVVAASPSRLLAPPSASPAAGFGGEHGRGSTGTAVPSSPVR